MPVIPIRWNKVIEKTKHTFKQKQVSTCILA